MFNPHRRAALEFDDYPYVFLYLSVAIMLMVFTAWVCNYRHREQAIAAGAAHWITNADGTQEFRYGPPPPEAQP